MLKLPEFKLADLGKEMVKNKCVLVPAEFRSAIARPGGESMDRSTGKVKKWDVSITYNVEIFKKTYGLFVEVNDPSGNFDAEKYNADQDADPIIPSGTWVVLRVDSKGYSSEKKKEFCYGELYGYLKPG